jgi:hydrogenase nickel incorporation protein HypB
MCGTCGCGDGPARAPRLVIPTPVDPGVELRRVAVELDLLAKNDGLARANRAGFAERGLLALNLMSSPGSGKTTLVERTVRALAGELPVAVIEGDQATDHDAARIRATGCPVVQINTGAGCHLDAAMVAGGVAELDPPSGGLLLVENVGNLVCPAMFDLGEHASVVVASVTEGEDKPAKYPHMFRRARLMLLNKIDLLPHVAFDVDACVAWARRVNPRLEVIEVSATRGDGLDAWLDWIRARRAEVTR